jgi:transposase InsO family protein
VRYGYRRLTVLLRREGWKISAKRVYRLYDEENLKVRSTERKKIARRQRMPQTQASGPNHCWSADFVSDKLADGRSIRILTVIDQFTRECVALEADRSMSGPKVVRALDCAIAERGASPQSMTLDNGSEFTGRAMEAWAIQAGVQLCFIRPGRPVENGFIESFNGRLRDECLNGSHRSRRRRKGWRRGENITTIDARIAHSTIGRRRHLRLYTVPDQRASPFRPWIRQTANRIKGSLRRLPPPLTRPAVCLKIPTIRAKRFYVSRKPETLY